MPAVLSVSEPHRLSSVVRSVGTSYCSYTLDDSGYRDVLVHPSPRCPGSKHMLAIAPWGHRGTIRCRRDSSSQH